MKNTTLLILTLLSLQLNAQQGKITKSDAQWKKELAPEVYQSLRKKATEKPFSGKYTDNFRKGNYYCAGCKNLLFESRYKYHSDTGWPAFDRSVPGSTKLVPDNSNNMVRTEVICSKCGGHLGHRFDDGPLDSTGKRFCINSIALQFIASVK